MAEEQNNPNGGDDEEGEGTSTSNQSRPRSINNTPPDASPQTEENFQKILFRLYEHNRKILERQIEETQREILRITTKSVRDQKTEILSRLTRDLDGIPKKFQDIIDTVQDGIVGAAKELKDLSDTTRGLTVGMRKTNFQMELSSELERRREKENHGRLARFFDGMTLGLTNFRNIVDREEVLKIQEKKLETVLEQARRNPTTVRAQFSSPQQFLEAAGITSGSQIPAPTPGSPRALEKYMDMRAVQEGRADPQQLRRLGIATDQNGNPVNQSANREISSEEVDIAKRFMMRTDYQPGRELETLQSFFEKSDMVVQTIMETAGSSLSKYGEEFQDIFKSLAAGIYETGMEKEEFAEKLGYLLKQIEGGDDERLLQALDDTQLQGEERKKFIRDILSYDKHLISEVTSEVVEEAIWMSKEEAERRAAEYTAQLSAVQTAEEKEEIRNKARKEGYNISEDGTTILANIVTESETGLSQEEINERLARGTAVPMRQGMRTTKETKVDQRRVREATDTETARIERRTPARKRLDLEKQKELDPRILKAKELQEEKEAILVDLEYGLKNKSERKVFTDKLKPLVTDPNVTPLEFQKKARQERFSAQTGLLFAGSVRTGKGFKDSVMNLGANFKQGIIGESISEAKYQAKVDRTQFIKDKVSSMTTTALTGGMLNKLLLLIPGIGPALSIAWTVISKTFSGILSVGKFLFSMVGKVFKVLGEVLSKVMELGTALLKGVAKYGTIALVAWVILFKTGLYKEIIPLITKVIKKVAPIVFGILTKILKVVNESLEGLVKELNEMLSGGIYDLPKKIFDFFFGNNGVFGGDSGFSALSTELGKFGDNLVRVGSILLDAFVELGKAIGDFFMDIAWPLYIKPAFSSFRDSLEDWSKTEFGETVMKYVIDPLLDGVDLFFTAAGLLYDFVMDIVSSDAVKSLLPEQTREMVTAAQGKRIASAIGLRPRSLSPEQLRNLGEFNLGDVSTLKKTLLEFKESGMDISNFSSLSKARDEIAVDAIMKIKNSQSLSDEDTEKAKTLIDQITEKAARSDREGLIAIGARESRSEYFDTLANADLRGIVATFWLNMLDSGGSLMSLAGEGDDPEGIIRRQLKQQFFIVGDHREGFSGAVSRTNENMSQLGKALGGLPRITEDEFERRVGILTQAAKESRKITQARATIGQLAGAVGGITRQELMENIADEVNTDERGIWGILTQRRIQGEADTEDYRNLAAQEIQADIGSKSSGMARELTGKLNSLPEDKKQPFIESVTKRGLFAYDKKNQSFVAKEDAIPSLYKTETDEGGQEITLVDEEGKPTINTGGLESYIHSLNTSFRTLMSDYFDPLKDALDQNTEETKKLTDTMKPKDVASMNLFELLYDSFEVDKKTSSSKTTPTAPTTSKIPSMMSRIKDKLSDPLGIKRFGGMFQKRNRRNVDIVSETTPTSPTTEVATKVVDESAFSIMNEIREKLDPGLKPIADLLEGISDLLEKMFTPSGSPYAPGPSQSLVVKDLKKLGFRVDREGNITGGDVSKFKEIVDDAKPEEAERMRELLGSMGYEEGSNIWIAPPSIGIDEEDPKGTVNKVLNSGPEKLRELYGTPNQMVSGITPDTSMLGERSDNIRTIGRDYIARGNVYYINQQNQNNTSVNNSGGGGDGSGLAFDTLSIPTMVV